MSSSFAVKAVIFDFGNVICFPPDESKIVAAAKTCGLSRDAFWDAFWTYRLDYDCGLLEPDEYWWKTLVGAGASFDKALLPRLIRHEVEFWNRFDDRVMAWIDQLRTAGYKVGMLSNLPRVLGEELRAIRGFLGHFDQVTLSYEIRSVKPQAAIYQHSLAGLQVEPKQALFLDDKHPNVAGAQDLGILAEVFTTWESFVEHRRPQAYGLPVPASASVQG